MKDWRGTEIIVGSRVLYPVRHGSALTLKEAVVTAIVPAKDADGEVGALKVNFVRSNKAWCNTRERIPVTLTSLNQVTVLS